MSEEQLTRFIAERQNEQDEFETFTAANGYALPNWKMEDKNGAAINGN